jgi:hypothetical protein
MLRNRANGTEGSTIESGSADRVATGVYKSPSGGYTSTPENGVLFSLRLYPFAALR